VSDRATRAEIASGRLRGSALLARILSVPFVERDAWVDDVLGFVEPPPDVPDLPRGSVPYLPCAVDEILAMVREVPVLADDELVDLGSGLGRVVLLAHLVSGAAALGVEIQGPLVALARERARELALPRVSFVCANAAEIALDGSVFFLYAPFNGAMRAAVLRRLEEVARRRPIVVGAVDAELHDLPWLLRRDPPATTSLTLYDSVVAGVPARAPGSPAGSRSRL
jgi:hypothetical protein